MTVFRLEHRLKFLLERWMQRGVRTRLLFIGGVIVLISLVGGAAAWLFSDQFPNLWEAVWWAFLRLTDPGYLGDDVGSFLRTLSTVITLLGYVVFLGSLVAILTQWLNATMRHLENGLTPIAVRDHMLILGWSNRTPTIVRELMLSEERVRRFLRRRGARRFRVVILMDEVTADRVVELREHLGDAWDARRIIFRSGSSLRLEHLRRVAYRDASVVIIPGAEFLLGGASVTDARVIKTLISLSPSESGDDGAAPAVVAEVFDSAKVAVAESSYRGGEIDVIASDSFIGRLIAQNIRHRGLSYVYAELLSHSRGNEVYVRRFTEFTGTPFGSLSQRFSSALLMGIVRREAHRYVSHLNPPSDFVVEQDDGLVFIARKHGDCEADLEAAPATPVTVSEPTAATPSNRRVLILGWSHKVMSLLREFAEYVPDSFEVDVLSRVPSAEREPVVARLAMDLERLQIRQIDGDYTLPEDLRRTNPGSYDNVVFLASDWMDSEEESDARTILGYVLLRSVLEEGAVRDVGNVVDVWNSADVAPASGPPGSESGTYERIEIGQRGGGGAGGGRPEVLIELMDPENARLFRRRAGEVIISPLILSHILAHVALRRELSAVFNELFAPGGAEIFFHKVSDYGLTGRRVSMADLQEAAQRRGEVALGLRLAAESNSMAGGVRLNPSRSTYWTLDAEDEVVVLAST